MIRYCIEKDETERRNAFVLRIDAPNNTKRPTLVQSASPHDRDALDLLFSKSDPSCLLPLISIPYRNSKEILKALAATGNLFFKEKSVVVDFYAPVELFFKAEILPEGKCLAFAFLKSNGKEWNISECDFLCAGPPHFFIKGIVAKFIDTDVSWKVLKEFAKSPSIILEGSSKDRFLKEMEEADCQLVLSENVSKDELSHDPDPMPILILKDRSGAFADLWIDYGKDGKIPHHDSLQSQIGKRKRNAQAESSWERDLLETDFIKKTVSNSHYYCPVDKVAKSLTFLLEIGWQVVDWKGNRVVRQGDFDLSLENKNNIFLASGSVTYESHKADLKTVIGAFNRRERFVQIGDNTVGLLPDRWETAAIQELAEEGEIVGDGIKIKHSQIGLIGDLLDSKYAPRADSSLQNLNERLKNFKGLTAAAPSDDFKGALRPYQQDGVNWLSFLWDFGFHGILADDMGLGKTVQVLAFLSRLPKEKPTLIVLPTSLLFNWKREIERFLPSHSPYIHHGPARQRDASKLAEQSIILTSYATLRLDLALFQFLSYECLILDEAQVIKNAQTQTAKAVCTLEARLRLSITGTPIENHLQELWSHFHFLMPELLGKQEEFLGELQAGTSDSRFLKRIKRRISPFILRRVKEEVAKDLPERIDQVVWIEMDEDQQRTYDEFLSGVRGGLLKKVEIDGLSKHRMEILEAILRLRQICCHPLLVNSETGSSGKLDMLLNDLETAFEEKRKVLVYSQFTSMLQLIAKECRQRQWSFAYLDGSTKNREEVVRQFQEDASVPLFLISLKAGGVGLNLTAADHVWLYDPWWNDAVEEQAINRAHRIGRHETVFTKRYIVAESIEEKMMKLKESKKNLIQEVIEDNLASSSLSENDLKFLLS